MHHLDDIEKAFAKPQVPKFNVGDTVDVHMKIVEGDKERVQIFAGTVIARKGHGINESFRVRKIVQGEGVERTFPLHSPRLVDVIVRRHGKVRRAKLYYLRERVGRATKVEEKITVAEKQDGAMHAAKTPAPPPEIKETKAQPAQETVAEPGK